MSKYSKEWPTDSETQKALTKNIDEIVDALIVIDESNELIKSIKEVAQDKYGIDGGYIAGLAKIKYDLKYNGGKTSEKIKEKSEMVELMEGM